ncbi:hypothetical protein BCR36DRAFT_585788 [Piromyces finnis]|uniref:Uncharacterized protein n=1 Tax=Piromyces finnis TaxID=1754191 RepID=A0A1Y1V1F1_9FUNG|nr:hypothetical protein BCR36DRAFT_585788 [Piromyces finnis]|eukprot:ORX45172.1 hypothetical protein BCR36DRAFT_585788 [Piromyces finnis]
MVKVHFNEKIEIVETYDAGDYDRTSVPITELNETEFNEMECYRLEMKKQTIEEYQKRWRNRNSTSSLDSNYSNSENENISPELKSCLIRKNSDDSNKLNVSIKNATVPIPMFSSLEEESTYFREGQPQPNIILNTPHSSDYNSDEFRQTKNNIELSSSLESNDNENKIHIFSESEQENNEKDEIIKHENCKNNTIISPLSFGSADGPTSDVDADIEESEDDSNSFIRVFEDSFEVKNNKDDDESDYIKDMSFTEGENSISLSHHIISDDIPTTSFHSSNHCLFTDSLFNTSPILSEPVIDTKSVNNLQVQDVEVERNEKEKKDKFSIQEKFEDFKESEEKEIIEEDDDIDDDEIDKHPHSDTYINYGGTQHINIKPRRQNIYDEYNGVSSCPFGKPISFLDDLPETFQTPLSSSLPSTKPETSNRSSSTPNLFGSPFSPVLKSPYVTSSSYSSRINHSNNSPNYNNGNNNTNDGRYLVSKRNYLSISSNRDSKPKSFSTSSQHRLSHFTTSKWEGIGSRSNKSNNNNSNSNNNNITNNTSNSNKYYPRPATKLVSNSPFSSSWIYDASF